MDLIFAREFARKFFDLSNRIFRFMGVIQQMNI